jgi:Zn finger protein HypA/HybF involved in hydrogenase expression
MDTPTINLACPLCKASIELNPAAYATRPCPGCGQGLKLAGGKMQGNIFWYWHFEVKCKDCGHVHLPTRGPYTTRLDCPGCGGVLWKRVLRAEDYEREG